MKTNSDIFDKIRIRKGKGATTTRQSYPQCEWDGCDQPGQHRAPKGRGREGQFFHFCTDHCAQYNKSYNYFAGMPDDAVATFVKDAVYGHRPTWGMGVNRAGEDPVAGPDGAPLNDPFGMFRGYGPRVKKEEAAPRRKLKVMEQRSFDTLELEETATPAQIKARYKELVKLHHPDANGGDRSSEDRLRAVIQAYNHLKQAGFCE